MKTVEEIRRERLLWLVATHGRMTDLCDKLGLDRTESAKLRRIANGNVRKERGNKPYNMGGTMARGIEEALLLQRGIMDTPVYPAAGPATVLITREPTRPYQLWPFQNVSPEQWGLLEQDERDHVEHAATMLIRNKTSHKTQPEKDHALRTA